MRYGLSLLFRFEYSYLHVDLRPMGVVAGLVNKADQTAAEIVQEIVDEAFQLLGSAHTYVGSAKL